MRLQLPLIRSSLLVPAVGNKSDIQPGCTRPFALQIKLRRGAARSRQTFAALPHSRSAAPSTRPSIRTAGMRRACPGTRMTRRAR
jgi:hypothetical protein